MRQRATMFIATCGIWGYLVSPTAFAQREGAPKTIEVDQSDDAVSGNEAVLPESPLTVAPPASQAQPPAPSPQRSPPLLLTAPASPPLLAPVVSPAESVAPSPLAPVVAPAPPRPAPVAHFTLCDGAGCSDAKPLQLVKPMERPHPRVWVAGLMLFLSAYALGIVEAYHFAGHEGTASLVPIVGVEYTIAKTAPPSSQGLILGASGALQMAGVLIFAAGLSF